MWTISNFRLCISWNSRSLCQRETVKEGRQRHKRVMRGGRGAVCLTDRYYSVSLMLMRDENLYHQSDSEGWPVSSQGWTFREQTHADTVPPYTQGEHGARGCKTPSADQFIALLSRKAEGQNTCSTLRWAVVPLWGHLLLVIIFGDLTK